MKKLSKDAIAWKVAQDLREGSCVNLGIGWPEKVASYVPVGKEVILHSENGILGMGPPPKEGEEDNDLINAGKKPVTVVNGAAFFHHADSFAMIRGGHIDVCVMGAFEVSVAGDLANWSMGIDSLVPAVGGAMDLAVGAKAVYVMMSHTTKAGRPKLLRRCNLPITARSVVQRIYTDLAVIEVTPSGFVARELANGLTLEDLQTVTEAEIILAPRCRSITIPDNFSDVASPDQIGSNEERILLPNG